MRLILAFCALPFAASATPSITAATALPLISLGSSASAGFVGSFSSWSMPGETITMSPGNGAPQTGLYAGNTGSVAVSPYSGTTLQNYLAVEPGGSITFSYATPQTSFGLLWGSIDSYNTIAFSDGVSLSGTDIVNALGNPSSGDILISGLAPFTAATLTTGQPAFEFVPGGNVAVPEPRSSVLYASGLAMLLGVTVAGRLLSRRIRQPAGAN